MTGEELDALAVNSKHDATARTKLVDEISGLVWWHVRRLRLDGADKMDFYQLGMVGVLESILRYDQSRGRFKSYATDWIRKRMIEFRDTHGPVCTLPQRCRREISRGARKDDAALHMPEPFVESIESPCEQEDFVDWEALAIIIPMLSSDARAVLRCRCLGHSFREIGNQFGKGRDWASDLCRRSITTLQRDLAWGHRRW